ncbi:hypothetical protein CH371_04805 [Leptospira wolffii]|uniref:HTH araC/xylS-type domain-containing protein n=1 Tax=Leptospira wolffii TaxID=409998 RepID=A0A2M9ZG12_9LEPT|nr:helix-turn-helix domain-containing protein [Leptospira wolffii]PJZ67362.1 hypothetical protein CH371_04805 [Leptospira wolffii]
MKVYWNTRENPEPYTVLPSRSCVFGVQVSGRIRWQKEEEVQVLEKAGLTGILTEHRKFTSTGNTRSLLIIASPYSLSSKLDFSLSEIKNRSIGLSDLFPASKVLSLLSDCEEEADSEGDGLAAWTRFWNSLPERKKTDRYIPEAERRIQEAKGDVSIRQLVSDLGISQSKLERDFKERIGLSPKEYASLVRFGEIFEHSEESENLTDLAYRSGYYDQAHFIREFRKFSGVSPKEWFRKKNGI